MAGGTFCLSKTMKELHDIVQAFDQSKDQGLRCALATVVLVEGSSYRRPGARMLVRDDGSLTGAISGGCLEGDALRKALLAINQQRALLVTYDTTDEDDAKLGVGLGCNGIIHILIEPVRPEDPLNPVELIRQVLRKRQPAVLATLFSLQHKKETQPGTCLFLRQADQLLCTIHEPLLKEYTMNEAARCLQQMVSSFKTYVTETKKMTAFVELIRPPVSLVVVGAGNDAQPLAAIADILGWQGTIVDGRANYARRERFPKAGTVLVAKPEDALKEMTIDGQTVFVLMTHNYLYDLAMLRQLIQEVTPYIGILGPRGKFERMIKELQEEGISLNKHQLSAIYGPTGVDIGAEGAEEIALSILAEIKKVLAGHSGKPLRSNKGCIHFRAKTAMEEVRLVSKQ
ncbi:MAG: XdhC family protein [Sediminibacterium sp.]